MKDTVRKGAITETKIIVRFLELGYNIFIPHGDGSKCDLVIQDALGHLYKVQCKTSRFQGNSEVFNAYSTTRTRSTGGDKSKIRYTKVEIDYFCSLDSEDNMYLIPVEEVRVMTPRLKMYTEFIIL